MEINKLTFMELQYHVEQLQGRYVECIDDDRLEEWPGFFTEDCIYKIISRENHDRNLPAAAIYCDSKGMLEDRIVSLRNANVFAEHNYRHLISNILIQGLNEGVISVQSNYLVLQTKTDGATEIYNAGKYVDRIVVDDGVLKFKEKIAIFDTHQIKSLLVTPI